MKDSNEQPQGQVGATALQKVREALEKLHPAIIWDLARMYYTNGTPANIRVIHKERCKEYDEALSLISQCEGDREILDWLLKPAGNQSMGVVEVASVKGSATWYFTREAIIAAMQAEKGPQ